MKQRVERDCVCFLEAGIGPTPADLPLPALKFALRFRGLMCIGLNWIKKKREKGEIWSHGKALRFRFGGLFLSLTVSICLRIL